MNNAVTSISNPSKSSILTELEGHLVKEEFNFDDKNCTLDTAIIVDFMSTVRSTNLKRFIVFGEILEFVWKNSIECCKAKGNPLSL